MPRNINDHVPVSSFLELVEAELALEAAIKTDSANLLIQMESRYGSKIGYKNLGYLINKFAGKEGYENMSAWNWKPAQAKWLSQYRQVPEWVRQLAASKLNGYTGDAEQFDVGDLSKLKEYYDFLK